MFRPIAPSQARLAGVLERSAPLELTYREVGATVYGEQPDGYHHDVFRRFVPDADFDRGVRAVSTWAGHHGAGALMVPSVPSTKLGTSMAFGIRVFGLWFVAACRIVGVVDEEDVYGIAYGTLPEHPERGEEIFLVRRLDGGLEFEVRSFSRPNSPLVWVSGPIGRFLQRTMTKRYLDALVRETTGDDEAGS